MKPIFSIWFRPRKTFDSLAQRGDKNNANINVIFFLISMSAGFPLANDFKIIFEINYYVALVFALILSGLSGLLILNTLFTYSIWGVSKLFEGKATKYQIRLVLAYSLVPNLIPLISGLILIVPAVVLNDIELITNQNPIATFIIWIFTTRIILIGLAFFNKYSYGYALLNIIIPIGILQGILYLLD